MLRAGRWYGGLVGRLEVWTDVVVRPYRYWQLRRAVARATRVPEVRTGRLLPPPRSRADARLLSPSAPARTLRPLLPADTRRLSPLRSTRFQSTRIPLPHSTDKRSINGGPLWIRIHNSQVIFSCIFRTTP